MNRNITFRKSQSLDSYLADVGKYPLPTPEKELELANRIKQGDEGAREEFINCNLSFVVSVAKQYQNKGLSMQELIEAGNKGLELAAKRFDPQRGFRFISYAVWFIRQSILQVINEHVCNNNEQ